MKKIILVLGMHRSGTSAVTGALARLGAAPPATLMPGDAGNEKGYFESPSLMRFNDHLLSLGESCWFDWRKFAPPWLRSPPAELMAEAKRVFFGEYGDSSLIVCKDPRMCRLIPFWLPFFEECGFSACAVLPFRNAFEVAQSLLTRHDLSIERGVLLWLRHVIDAERETRQLPRAFVSMDEFLSDWRNSARRLSQNLGVAWPHFDAETAAEIDDFLSIDLKHHNSNLGDSELAMDWVERLYEALLILAHNSNSIVASAVFDDVSKGFETACDLMGSELMRLEAANVRLRAEISSVEREREPSLGPSGPTLAASPGAQDQNGGLCSLDKFDALRVRTSDVRETLERLRSEIRNAR